MRKNHYWQISQEVFAFSDINFKANVKLDENGDPIVTDEEANDSTIVSVELKKIINKNIL